MITILHNTLAEIDEWAFFNAEAGGDIQVIAPFGANCAGGAAGHLQLSYEQLECFELFACRRNNGRATHWVRRRKRYCGRGVKKFPAVFSSGHSIISLQFGTHPECTL